DRIEDGIDVLMVAHATELGPAQLYAIDQYVLKGGKALVLVDPYSETAAAMAMPAGPMGMPQAAPATRSDLGPLLAAWGLDYDPTKVVADLELAQRVNMGGESAGGRQIVDYVAWLGVRDDFIAKDDIVAAELASVTFASAGALVPTADDAAGITALFTSSDHAALIDADKVAGRPDPDRLIRELVPTGQRYMLAARIRRAAATAYPDGPPAREADTPEQPASDEAQEDRPPLPAHVAASNAPINVILVADADVLEDRFWAQVRNFFGERIVVPVADNGRFIVNAVDNLSGSDALISLRSRGVSSRPFTLIEKLRRAAEARYLDEQERLENALRVAEQRLSELQNAGDGKGDGALLSAEQIAEVERFRAEAVETRRALRTVQRNLRRDIDRLEAWVRGI
ncbi:MAG: ABC transporter, partial [Alphaproteobacteria bacterium]